MRRKLWGKSPPRSRMQCPPPPPQGQLHSWKPGSMSDLRQFFSPLYFSGPNGTQFFLNFKQKSYVIKNPRQILHIYCEKSTFPHSAVFSPYNKKNILLSSHYKSNNKCRVKCKFAAKFEIESFQLCQKVTGLLRMQMEMADICMFRCKISKYDSPKVGKKLQASSLNPPPLSPSPPLPHTKRRNMQLCVWRGAEYFQAITVRRADYCLAFTPLGDCVLHAHHPISPPIPNPHPQPLVATNQRLAKGGLKF